MDNETEATEALTKEFADLIFEHGLRAPDSTVAVIAFKEVIVRRLPLPVQPEAAEGSLEWDIAVMQESMGFRSDVPWPSMRRVIAAARAASQTPSREAIAEAVAGVLRAGRYGSEMRDGFRVADAVLDLLASTGEPEKDGE